MQRTNYQKALAVAAFPALCLGTPTLAHESDFTTTSANQYLAQAALISDAREVPCTLSEGAETTCLTFSVKPLSEGTGPWCPSNVSDGPDQSGIWLDGGEVYDADGAFFEKLSTFYDDDNWAIADPTTGKINVTDSAEACAAAARPDVDPAYQNFCVQCLPEYVNEAVTITYTIPLEPVPASAPARTGFAGSGVALDGGRLDGPAPVDAILGAYTVAPFDDCGGHVNLNVGYHYHAVTGCIDGQDAALDAPVIGIAMDGYVIAEYLEDASLDECNGHAEDGQPYHYHAGAAGSNAILGCLKAQYGCSSEDENATCDASQSPRRGPPPTDNN